MSKHIMEYRPKIDAVIIELIEGQRILSIEYVNEHNLPILKKWANDIINTPGGIL